MAVEFDGDSSFVDEGSLVYLQGAQFALAFRCYLRSVALNDEIISQFTSATGGVRVALIIATTTFTLQIGAATNVNCSISNSVETGTWQHWFIAYDGSQSTNATKLRIFLNGVEQTVSFSTTVPTSIVSPGGLPLTMGSITATRSMTGLLSDLMIWNVVLPDSVLKSQHQSFNPLQTSGLQLWEPLHDGVVFKDYSGNNRDTITNVGVVRGCIGNGVSMGHPVLELA